jgi:serine protease AprX
LRLFCEQGEDQITKNDFTQEIFMNRIKKITLSLVVLLTIVGLVGGIMIPTPASAASVQPQLIELAVQMPDKVISVIAQKMDTTQRAEKMVIALGGTVTKDLHIINAFAAEMPAGEVPKLAASGTVRWVSLDGALERAAKPTPKTEDIPEEPSPGLPPNFYLDTMNVREVWDMGFHGEGIGVAVIDSGISMDRDFSPVIGKPKSRIVWQMSFNDNSFKTADATGHGTHVAGIIGGNGTASDGYYRGVAPKVNLVNLKISDENGMANESDAVAALQWVFDNKDNYNIRVVNLSVQSSTEITYHQSPMDAAAEILWFNGVVVVVAAGNTDPQGLYNPTLAAPANDPFLISVGASTENGTDKIEDDVWADFSARGTTQDGYFKPEIYAPGKDIISVLSDSSRWDLDYPEKVVLPEEYIRLSGTSMSAPMVTGAVALLLQAEPDLTPDQVKYRLVNASASIQGYPYLDVHVALTTYTTENANTGLTASQLLWTGEEPITWESVAWNSVAWNSVAWNSVAWNSVAWNSVAWNSVAWND